MVSLIEGLRERHRREVVAMGDVERPHGLAPHASSSTLQRRRQEAALAGLQRYVGAQTVQPPRWDTVHTGCCTHLSERHACLASLPCPRALEALLYWHVMAAPAGTARLCMWLLETATAP